MRHSLGAGSSEPELHWVKADTSCMRHPGGIFQKERTFWVWVAASPLGLRPAGGNCYKILLAERLVDWKVLIWWRWEHFVQESCGMVGGHLHSHFRRPTFWWKMKIGNEVRGIALATPVFWGFVLVVDGMLYLDLGIMQWLRNLGADRVMRVPKVAEVSQLVKEVKFFKKWVHW